MRKTATGAALITAVGFSALTMAPATAAALPFPNCDAAVAAGIYNIPATSPAYAPGLDSDSDGVGCESEIYAYDAVMVDRIVAELQQLEELPPNTGIIAGPEGTGLEEAPQVEQVPVGGANTGVNLDTGVPAQSAENNGAIAVAGALAMAAVVGGALVVRSRTRTV